ncbi:MAG TPA: YggS family pyridoxal phosphate-dependent enzyme [Desulfotomaculum sp.]|nr:YggS family pyridoxal phosphate-dependent enzyme [Desulfotomaculum sp.]
MTIYENLRIVKEKIEHAARKAGRAPASVKLIAVTKTVPADIIKHAVAAGVTALGENKAQEMLFKQPLLPPDLEWHFIGRLQSNKVKSVIGKVSLIHSLDSWKLALTINDFALKTGRQVIVLVQVNISGETSKQGLPPAQAADFIKEVITLKGIKIRGLMTIAPETADPEEVRPVFRDLRLLAGRLKNIFPGVDLEYLSMGMSSDFVVAVEEGSNMLRLGTAIFGPRK